MAELGINADGRAAIEPASLAALGAKWVRCVAYPDEDISGWIRACHQYGMKVLLVLARESIGQARSGWAANIAKFRGRYGGQPDAWQVGNEADHVSPSSWTMSQDDLSMLLRVARFQLGPDVFIVGAGMADGQPSWADSVDWSPVNAFGVHPYAKDPNTAQPYEPIDELFDGYARQGKPLWVTEYHARSLGMAAALRDDPRIQVALAFCYTDRMVDGFGLIEDYRALNDFTTAAREQGPPAPQPAEFVLGFAKWAAIERHLLGDPLTNEHNVAPEWQIQPTSNGVLSWVGGKGHAFVTHQGRVYRWQEDWPASREVG